MQSFAALLPTRHGDHVAAAMQYVENRIVRSVPTSMRARAHIVALGYGANSWYHVTIREHFAD